MYHLKDALYFLWYIYSTPDLGINFFSMEYIDTHDQIYHPIPYYKETYSDAYTPMTTSNHEFMSLLYIYWCRST